MYDKSRKGKELLPFVFINNREIMQPVIKTCNSRAKSLNISKTVKLISTTLALKGSHLPRFSRRHKKKIC